MKKSDLKPGTKVLVSRPNNDWDDREYVKYYYDEYGENTCIGTILDKPAKTGKVWLSWADDDYNAPGEMAEIDIKILIPESARSKIEEEFKLYSKEVKTKMKEAAALVREASKLADKAHASSLAEMYDAIQPLVSAMDSSGWNSSSWGC